MEKDNMMKTIQNLIQKIEQYTSDTIEKVDNDKSLLISQSVRDSYGQFNGCTEEEIDEVMRIQRVKSLPEPYKNILRQIGKYSGGIIPFPTYEEIKRLKSNAIWFLEAEEAPLKLPSDAFVFYADQGSYFEFFHTANTDQNSLVYRYTEGGNSFEIVAANLLEWFETYIETIISVYST
jgi:hypothetical protein